MRRGDEAARGEGLAFWYDPKRPLFADLDFVVHLGERVAVSGPSGSGKSTLLSIVAGLQQPRTGTVTLHPEVGTPCCVVQVPIGVPRRTTADHIGLVLAANGRPHDSIDDALAVVGLRKQATTAFGALSGGEAQRLMVAMALASGARLILLDEPTSQLDRKSAAGVVDVLAGLALGDTALVIASHDPSVIDSCDAVISVG